MGISILRGRGPALASSLAGLVALAPGATPIARAAQEATVAAPAPPPVGGVRREMAGHSFIAALLVREPFASTYFDIRTAAGVAEGRGPLFDATGGTLGFHDYTLAALAQSYELQIGLLSWLAVRASG